MPNGPLSLDSKAGASFVLVPPPATSNSFGTARELQETAAIIERANKCTFISNGIELVAAKNCKPNHGLDLCQGLGLKTKCFPAGLGRRLNDANQRQWTNVLS